MHFTETHDVLRSWGDRLRIQRLDRNEPMKIFAERIGVSEGTLRAMERGLPTVAVGSWINALAALDRIDDVNGVLERHESLIERARASASEAVRQRASRRRA